MRPLELLVVVFVCLWLLALMVPSLGRKEISLYPPIFVLAAIVAQQWIESFRWQMAPVYALTVPLVAVTLWRHMRTNRYNIKPGAQGRSKVRIVVYTSLAALPLSAGVALMVFFPVVDLTDPTGPYAVGTTFLDFVDSSRTETRTDAPNDLRKFEARVWYPAEAVSGYGPLPYLEYAAPVGALAPGPPAIVFKHLNLASSNSYLDAPVSSGETAFPVLLMAVGFLAGYEEHQLSAEELASHGYVVVGVTNPYESASVVEADGSVTPYSAAHAEGYLRHTETIIPLWSEFWASEDAMTRHEIAKRILASENFMDSLLRIRVADLRFVMDQLERMNRTESGGMFSGKLDLSRLGVLGHSMGGAVAGQLCLVDERVKAGVNLDGFQWGDVAEGTVQQPFMTAYSEIFEGANDFLVGNFRNELLVLTIAGSTHMNFTDWPFVLPITQRLGMAGTIDPARAVTITNSYLLAFFNKHLKGADSPLLDGDSVFFAEVQLDVKTSSPEPPVS